MIRKSRICFLSVFFLTAFLSFTLSPQAQTFDATKKQVKIHSLGNGMKFIVLERHDAPVVSFHVYADVGSANESYGITGISHILEHMAFKGTKVVGTKDYAAESKILNELDAAYDQMKKEEAKPNPDRAKVAELKAKFTDLEKKAKEYVVNNEYFDMMMREGDAGVNAYTSNDATQYINYLPSNRLEFWMAVTSDRFLNPVFREFFKERDVIMEERRLGVETQPTGKLMEDFMAVAFKAHPYHHEVVGHMSDLQAITRKDVEDYFKKFYSPSNLTVGIVGDVKADEVFKLAETYFSRVPSGSRPEPVRTKEPEQWGERRVAVSAKSQPFLLIGYHVPDARNKDSRAIEAMANILGQGRSSRLYTTLVKDKKIAVMVQSMSGFPSDKFPNLFAVIVMPAAGKTAAECQAAVEEELEKIKKDAVTEDELTKFKRSSIKSALAQLRSNPSMAALLTYADVVLGDYGKAFDQIDEIKALTAEDIKRVANQYLIKTNRTIGEIVTEK
ncbi:MAG: pitrilysin family protein [Candidatus Aminicenantes bacterium]|nr:pitrilysin family protein [Candidatus Aminicenantes bacterium]